MSTFLKLFCSFKIVKCVLLRFRLITINMTPNCTFYLHSPLFPGYQKINSQKTFVLMKTSFVFVFRRCPQDVSLSRQICSPQPCVFRRRLQDVFKTSWSRPMYSSWPYVLKACSRRLHDLLPRFLQDVFKTSCNNVFKTF